MTHALEVLRGHLIVSCQATEPSPLRDTYVIRRLVSASIMAGAAAARVDGAADVAAVREDHPQLPIIGIHKVPTDARPFITPGLEHARAIQDAGADIVATDCTAQVQSDIGAHVRLLKRELECLVMADVSTVEEGLQAWEAGADVVGTTVAGYTPYTAAGADAEPDIDLVAALTSRGVRTIAEGRYRRPEQVAAAFGAGAHAVVVGSAITDPMLLTSWFHRQTPAGAATRTATPA